MLPTIGISSGVYTPPPRKIIIFFDVAKSDRKRQKEKYTSKSDDRFGK